VIVVDHSQEYAETVARIRRRLSLLDRDALPDECREILEQGIDIEALARRAVLRRRR
jgi:hypothetical protein